MSKKRDLLTPQERQKYENMGRVDKGKFTTAMKPELEKRARTVLGLKGDTPVRVEGGYLAAVQEAAPVNLPPAVPRKDEALGFGDMVKSDHQRFLELSRKYNIDPLEGLFQALADPEVPMKEKIAIQKFLVPYQVVKKPELKAIDVQQDLKMNVRVELTSFGRTAPGDLPAESVALHDTSVYDEFMDEDFGDDPLSEQQGEPGE